MINSETAVDTRLARQAIFGTAIAALLGVIYLVVVGKSWVYVASVLAGTIFALVPILRQAQKTPPKSMSDIVQLSRISTKTFVIWLVMMAVYLVMLMPMGPDIFKLGVATCVVGLLASRLVFPICAACLLEAFAPPQSRHDTERP